MLWIAHRHINTVSRTADLGVQRQAASGERIVDSLFEGRIELWRWADSQPSRSPSGGLLGQDLRGALRATIRTRLCIFAGSNAEIRAP